MKLDKKDNLHIVIYIISVVVLVVGVINIWSTIPEKIQTLAKRIVLFGGVSYLLYVINN